MRRQDARNGVGLVAAIAVAIVALFSSAPAFAQGDAPSGVTPAELVSSYQTLADAILAVKKTETNLVRAILATAHAHAEIQVGRAQKAIKSGDARAAQAAVEGLATRVAELATEGDAAVAAVRKRLLEGGHHHNAEGEAKGVYDQGFVVVTRAARQIFLDASRAIGQQARAAKSEALEAEWKKVEAAYAGLMKTAP